MTDADVTAAGLACAACGTAMRVNAKFCDECGSPLAASLGFEGHMAMAEAM